MVQVRPPSPEYRNQVQGALTVSIAPVAHTSVSVAYMMDSRLHMTSCTTPHDPTYTRAHLHQSALAD